MPKAGKGLYSLTACTFLCLFFEVKYNDYLTNSFQREATQKNRDSAQHRRRKINPEE